MHRLVAVCVALCALVLGGAESSADIWSYEDADGVLHFRNTAPRGKEARKWKLYRKEKGESLGKETQRRGDCERCDRVPARDNSAERFTRYDDIIAEASERYDIPVALIRAVIKVESDFDPRVVSAFGARGLMQLMPAVVKDMGVKEVHDPRQNILGGTRLLRVLANRYEGDLVRTIAAYHAGVGSLAKYGDEVPPYFNTRRYLKMVLQRYEEYRARER